MTYDDSPVEVARLGEVNGDPHDRFTLLHMFSGAVMGWWDFPFESMMLVNVLWETAEFQAKEAHPEWFPRRTQESGYNLAADVIAVWGGWWFAKLAKEKLENNA